MPLVDLYLTTNVHIAAKCLCAHVHVYVCVGVEESKGATSVWTLLPPSPCHELKPVASKFLQCKSRLNIKDSIFFTPNVRMMLVLCKRVWTSPLIKSTFLYMPIATWKVHNSLAKY